jgi:DNA-binding response OmpR family regulator
MTNQVHQITTKKPVALYGDDCLSSRSLILRILEHFGFATIIAYSSADILEKAEQVMPDVIILDEVCDVSNLDVCRKLKVNERVKHIPVILLINPADANFCNEVIELGAVDYLKKPIDIDDLRVLVEIYL